MSTQIQQNHRTIAKGAGTSLLGFVAKLGVRAPFLLIAGSLYGSELFGRYVIIVALMETASALATYGLKRTLFKFIDDDKDDPTSPPERTILEALFLTTASSILFMMVFLFGSQYILGFLNSPETINALRFLSPLVVVSTIADILLAATRFRRTMRYEALSRSVIEPLTLTSTSFVLFYMGAHTNGLFIAYGLSLLAAFITAGVGFSRLFSLKALAVSRIRRSKLVYMIQFSGPTALTELVTILLFRADVMLISYFYSDSSLGIYGMAQQFATSVQKIHVSFNPILTPVISSLMAEDRIDHVRDQLARVSRWILSLQLMVVVGIVFFGGQLLSLMGEGFVAGGLALTLLVLGDVLNGSFGVSDLPLLLKRPSYNLVITSIMLVVHILMGYYLTMKMGIAGAALSLLVTYGLMNFIRIFLVKILFGVILLDRDMLRPILVSGVCGLLVYALNPQLAALGWLGMLIGFAVIIVSYSLMMLIFGLEKTEKQYIFGRLCLYWQSR